MLKHVMPRKTCFFRHVKTCLKHVLTCLFSPGKLATTSIAPTRYVIAQEDIVLPGMYEDSLLQLWDMVNLAVWKIIGL